MLAPIRNIISTNIEKYQQQGREGVITHIISDEMHNWPQSSINPIIISLAGLPGCGKTQFAKKYFRNQHYFVLDPDEYREGLLKCRGIKGLSIDNTQFFMLAVSYSLLEIAIYLKISIVVLDTYTDWKNWFCWFDSSNESISYYRKKLIILSQSLKLCEEGMKRRYDNEVKTNAAYARKPDLHFLEVESHHMELALEKYLSSKLFDDVYLLGRNGLSDQYTHIHSLKRLELVEKWKDITFSDNKKGEHYE